MRERVYFIPIPLGPKSKGVSDQPHPKDRQSGTGRGKESRKEGGGRGNWGNYKDDLK